MGRYIANRLLMLIPTLFVVSIVVFGLQKLLPGDVAIALAGEDKDPTVIAQIRAQYHLNQPILTQYALWLGNVARGDLGRSMRNQVSVVELIRTKLPATMMLSAIAMAWALAIGVPTGIVSALRKGSWLDYLSNVVGLAGLSVPPFWLGLMLILLVSVDLGWLPASGYVSPFENLGECIRSLLMPSFVLGINVAGVIMRHTRSAMLTAMSADYIRTARAKGLKRHIIVVRHAFRNALVPLITISALQLGALLSGAVLTEQVFTIPGFGRLIVDSVYNRDYSVVQGVVLTTATIYMLLNLLADLAYAVADPRVRR
jgi:peptide/nickel transport system permease protein